MLNFVQTGIDFVRNELQAVANCEKNSKLQFCRTQGVNAVHVDATKRVGDTVNMSVVPVALLISLMRILPAKLLNRLKQDTTLLIPSRIQGLSSHVIYLAVLH